MKRCSEYLAPLALALTLALVPGGCVEGPGGAPVSEDAPSVAPVDRARLVFIGDVMSHLPQVTAAATPTGHDYSPVFRHVKPLFGNDGHDRFGRKTLRTVAVANLETTLRTAPPYTGYPSFAAPAALATAMRAAGIDIATTANNHICDKGAAGIRSTLALLDSAGIRHTGAFLDSADLRARHPLRFTAGGISFALFAYTYGTNGIPVPRGMIVNLIDTALIARDLAAIAARPEHEKPDCVIVSYHWGEEYRVRPDRNQRELAAWTRARGADLIIGGHPHVVQPAEPGVYYSLGNFVSNQIRHRSDGGIAAEILVSRADTISYACGWSPLWVHTPVRAGIRRYEVLPVATAAAIDTLPAGARAAARLFVDETRALVAPTLPE